MCHGAPRGGRCLSGRSGRGRSTDTSPKATDGYCRLQDLGEEGGREKGEALLWVSSKFLGQMPVPASEGRRFRGSELCSQCFPREEGTPFSQG